jgi:hypothetical protein
MAARRIERDEGDPDDEVLILREQSHRANYHTDPDCQYISADAAYRTTSRREAQRAEQPPCKQCVLGEIGEGSSQRTPLRTMLNQGTIEPVSSGNNAGNETCPISYRNNTQRSERE